MDHKLWKRPSWKRFGFGRTVALLTASCVIVSCGDATPTTNPLSEQPTDTQITRADDPVVARVNGTEIYRTDVQRAATAQGLITLESDLVEGGPVFQTTLDSLIDERLLALDAVRNGVNEQEEARRRLAAARERILSNLRVETELAQNVTEAAIRDLYDRQSALGNRGEERRIRQIVVDTEETATEVLTRLEDEEDFEAVAAELSTDVNTRGTVSALGWMSRDMVAAPLRTAVFQTAVGGRAGPVAGPDGWYVIEIVDSRAPGQRSFEEVREDIERFMTFETIDALMTDLRRAAEIDLVYQQSGSETSESAPSNDRPETETPNDE